LPAVGVWLGAVSVPRTGPVVTLADPAPDWLAAGEVVVAAGADVEVVVAGEGVAVGLDELPPHAARATEATIAARNGRALFDIAHNRSGGGSRPCST
jgi:hypothetical protein